MKTEAQHIEFIDLIGKYLSWEASSDEISSLENWVAEDAEHKAIFQQYSKTWQLSKVAHLNASTNINQEWDRLLSHIDTSIKSKIIPIKKKSNRLIYSLVASVLLLFSVCILYYFLQFSTKQIQTQKNTYAFYLEDSSKVTLNQFSSIEYSKQYNQKDRRLQLAGEAYFEVTPDSLKPFIVETQGMEIRVLGTGFYVNSRVENETVEVVVEHGKVAVTSPEKKQLILTKGEKAIFQKSQKQLEKTLNLETNYLAWENQLLVFKVTPLSKVVADINKAYHIDMRIDEPELKELQLTATYNQKSLAAVLKLLSESLDLRIAQEQQTIHIKSAP